MLYKWGPYDSDFPGKPGVCGDLWQGRVTNTPEVSVHPQWAEASNNGFLLLGDSNLHRTDPGQLYSV